MSLNSHGRGTHRTARAHRGVTGQGQNDADRRASIAAVVTGQGQTTRTGVRTSIAAAVFNQAHQEDTRQEPGAQRPSTGPIRLRLHTLL